MVQYCEIEHNGYIAFVPAELIEKLDGKQSIDGQLSRFAHFVAQRIEGTTIRTYPNGLTKALYRIVKDRFSGNVGAIFRRAQIDKFMCEQIDIQIARENFEEAARIIFSE